MYSKGYNSRFYYYIFQCYPKRLLFLKESRRTRSPSPSSHTHYETVKAIINTLYHHAVELLCVSLNSRSGFRVTSLKARHYRAFPECQACTRSHLMRQDKGYFSYSQQRRQNCLFWDDYFILDEQNRLIIYSTVWLFISAAIKITT